MPRYIDVDALKKDIRENYVVYGYEDFINDFFRCLDEQSPVDAVEVVRCKDCKWQMTAYCPMPSWEKKDNHYCYKGEREEEPYCGECGAKMDEEEK